MSNVEIEEAMEEGLLDVSPLEEHQLQPASIDLRLGKDFIIYSKSNRSEVLASYIDSKSDIPSHLATEKTNCDSIMIEPNKFYLGTTVERVTLSSSVFGEISGRSSIGRLGIEVHSTAGICDPGWSGQVTLEISNNMPVPIELYQNQRICQVVFSKLNKPSNPAYGEKADSKYQNQTGPTESRVKEDE